jgi:hypothetical protein
MGMSANERQVGGEHYKRTDGGEEHWDRVARLKLDYFQAQVTKYVERCWLKNGIEDLKKARHFLDKYIELKENETTHLEGFDQDEVQPDPIPPQEGLHIFDRTLFGRTTLCGIVVDNCQWTATPANATCPACKAWRNPLTEGAINDQQ